MSDKSSVAILDKKRERMSRFLVPDEVEAVFREFRTAELSTLRKDGIPVTWPLVVVYRPDERRFACCTSIGLCQKALNIRRNPHVSLLYSEPKGSGLASPPAVLVQGDAECPDEITSAAGLEDVWRAVFLRQPASRSISNNWLSRKLIDCYYMRLRILITPLRILWWPNGDFAREPQRIEVNHVG